MFKYLTLGGFAVIAILVLILSSQIWESNPAGHIQVKQAATTGAMSVRTTPGMYYQGFGTITTYPMSDTYDFTQDKITVKFNDGSTAVLGGQVQFKLPTDEESVLSFHRDFRSYEAIMAMAKRVVSASLVQSANLFRAEDIYSMRRSEFIDLVTDQIREGIYSTDWRDEWTTDTDTKERTLIKRVEIRRDKNGQPIVNDKSQFKIYGIDLVGQVLVSNIDFDDLTDGLITKRKEAEQQQVVARANAERAKQDAITAMEEGKRDIAKAEALALVEQKKAVVDAERETKVAQQKALQAEEEKKAIIAKGEADAAATKLKVAAGLSPLEKAQFDRDTAIGVAQALAGINLPGVMVIGGDGKGGQINPFDAVGLESFIRMSKNFQKQNGGEVAQ